MVMSFVYFIYLLTYLFIIFITYTRICAGAFLQTTGTEGEKRRPSRLKSLRGLAFQNDAAIATTQSPLQKKEEENIQTPLKQMNDCHRWMPKKNKWICQ